MSKQKFSKFHSDNFEIKDAPCFDEDQLNEWRQNRGTDWSKPTNNNSRNSCYEIEFVEFHNHLIVKRHSVSLSWEEIEITFRTARNIFRTNGRKLKNFDTYSYVCFFHTWFTLTGHICTNDSDNWSHTRSSCPLCWKIWDRFENNPIRFAPCTNPKWQVLWNCFVREHSKSVPNLPLLFARAKNCSI